MISPKIQVFFNIFRYGTGCKVTQAKLCEKRHLKSG